MNDLDYAGKYSINTLYSLKYFKIYKYCQTVLLFKILKTFLSSWSTLFELKNNYIKLENTYLGETKQLTEKSPTSAYFK